MNENEIQGGGQGTCTLVGGDGNQFIYWRDKEIDADYITKVPKEEQK